ncbi:MAG: hypothetical protein JJU18_02105 [Oceanicaulis sp.]|nr:hypothetical protein [Oceanicaulis sp.]
MAFGVLTALLGAISVTACAVAAQDGESPPASPWGQDVHVFGGTLIDLERRVFRFGPFRRRLQDCSNAEYLCLTGLDIVLPRTCGRHDPGTVWEASGVRTVVLAERRRQVRIHEGPPDMYRYVYLLATEGQPWLVFEYEAEAGVVALFMDTIQPHGDTLPLDIRNIALQGEIESLRFGPYFDGKVTERSFGACPIYQ